MSATLTALAIYGFWTLLLLLIVVVARGADNMINGTALNAFDPQGEGMFPFGQRVTRAHLNCVENLPPFIAIVVTKCFFVGWFLANSLSSGIDHLQCKRSVFTPVRNQTPMRLHQFDFIRTTLNKNGRLLSRRHVEI